MNRIINVCCLLFILTNPMIGQERLSIISGKVVAEDNGNPLPFAHIGLKNKPIGTITNRDGEFNFHIPGSSIGDTLFISMLGYVSFADKVVNLIQKVPLEFRMEINPVVLDEIVIRTGDLLPYEILNLAFDNLNRNFFGEPYIMEGFHRRVSREDDKTVLLTEAVVEIYDPGYRHSRRSVRNERVKVKNDRTSFAYFESPYEDLRGSINSLNLILDLNHIRHDDPVKYREEDDIRLDSIFSQNGLNIYVIRREAKYKGIKNIHTFYIDDKNYSILKVVTDWPEKDGYNLNKREFQNNKAYSFKVKSATDIYEFENYDDKMFLKYAHVIYRGGVYCNASDSAEWKITTEASLVINNVITENASMKKKGTMKKSESLWFQTKEYNSEFWSDYEKAKLVPLTKKQIKDLESELPLEEQFQIINKKNND